jgi:hypothetical protein
MTGNVRLYGSIAYKAGYIYILLIGMRKAAPPPNKPLKLTPLRGLKIGAILKFGYSPSAFPVY